MAKKIGKGNKVEVDLLRIAAFILFDALIFHHSISANNAAIRPLSKLRPPYRKALLEEWKRILQINYREVFELAREILEGFPAAPETEGILQELLVLSEDTASSGILRKHDFLGRIYHKLLLRTTGQFYATYYTSIPSAWLLAQLAVRTEHPDWNFQDSRHLTSFRMIDPACGSGTLLSAAYMALRDAYAMSPKPSLPPAEYHRHMIENVISGWDVLDYAAHLTLTTLALHQHAEFTHSKIFVLPTGIDEHDSVRLGSLDHLNRQIELVGKGLDFGDVALRKGLEVRQNERIPDEHYDLVIMNPPFSRSAKPNVKFGYTPVDVKSRMDAALKAITRDLGLQGIGHAGLGAYFVKLADSLVKANGRIAFVLPRALLSGVSWTKIRELISDDYAIEYVLSNYDPGDPVLGIEPWSWSENTELGEVLVVARKLPPHGSKRSGENVTTYVCLWNKPRNEVESLLLSQQVQRKRKGLRDLRTEMLRIGEREVGHIIQVNQSRLSTNWLFPCLFANPALNQLSIRMMAESKEFVPLKSLCDSIGTDIKQIKDNFHKSETPSPHRILWGQQASMNSIKLPDMHQGFGHAVRGNESELLHRRQRSKLLISERPHLHNDPIIATTVSNPVLATAFWEIQMKDPNLIPGLVIWLNSTYGLLSYLGISTNSMGEIFKTKKEQLATFRVPTADSLLKPGWGQFFEQHQSIPLEKVAASFESAANGTGMRLQFDQFVKKSLGLKFDFADHYSLLAKEPIFTLQRLC